VGSPCSATLQGFKTPMNQDDFAAIAALIISGLASAAMLLL
jgi:hypothetical protein